MKKILLLSVFLIYSFIHSQTASGCSSSNWPSSVSTNTLSEFVGTPGSGSGWTYKWVVSGDLLISPLASFNPYIAYIKGTTPNSTGTVYFTRFKNGVMACSDKKVIDVEGCETDCPTYTDVNSVSCAPASNISPGGIEWHIFLDVNNPFCNPATYQTIVSSTPFFDILGNFHVVGGLSVGGSTNIERQYELGYYAGGPNNYTGNISILYIDSVTDEECLSFINVESYCTPSDGGGGGGDDPKRSIDNNENKNSNYIFPNPLKRGEYLNIMNIDINKIIDIKVFDIQGDEIKNTNIVEDKLYFDSNSRGLHFVKIYTIEGIITEKLIVD